MREMIVLDSNCNHCFETCVVHIYGAATSCGVSSKLVVHSEPPHSRLSRINTQLLNSSLFSLMEDLRLGLDPSNM
jgi:hypothetical protein